MKLAFSVQRLAFSLRKKFNYFLLVFFCFYTLYAIRYTLAQEKPTSSELITMAWEAHGKRDIGATFKYTQQCIDLYKDEAGNLHASLKALPKSKDEIEVVQVLNDVATA